MSDGFTKSGAVVWRRGSQGVYEFLLVTGRKRPGSWVLPLGSIESGETPEAAAAREVAEEAGVAIALPPQAALDDVCWTTRKGRRHRCAFYLSQFERCVDWPEEGRRERAWLTFDQAIGRLPDLFHPPLQRAVATLAGQ